MGRKLRQQGLANNSSAANRQCYQQANRRPHAKETGHSAGRAIAAGWVHLSQLQVCLRKRCASCAPTSSTKLGTIMNDEGFDFCVCASWIDEAVLHAPFDERGCLLTGHFVLRRPHPLRSARRLPQSAGASHMEQGRWVQLDRGHSCPLFFFVSTDMRRTRMSAVQVRTPTPPPYANDLPQSGGSDDRLTSLSELLLHRIERATEA